MSKKNNGRAAYTGATDKANTTRKHTDAGAVKFKWTARQAENAKRKFSELAAKDRRTCERIADANGCEPWEVVADTLAFRSNRKARMRIVALEPQTDGTDAPCTAKPSDAPKPISAKRTRAAKKRATTAKPTEKPRKIWHTIRAGGRDGVEVLESPDGEQCAGSAADVRDIGMYPYYRKNLAETIWLFHRLFVSGDMSREEFTKVVRSRRRENIMYSIIARSDKMKDLHENERVVIGAAARHMGMTFNEFTHDAIQAAVEAAINDAGGALPLTRYERAALIAGGYAV